MKMETKHVMMWGGTMAVGLLTVWATLKYHAANNGATTNVAPSSGADVGTPPIINIIGGSNPSTWNLAPDTQPSGADGVGASTSEVNLPVISNYNTTQNSGCDSCSNAPDAYYASAIMANAAITSAMLHQEGYTKTPGGEIVPPGYYNMSGEMGSQGPQLFDMMTGRYTTLPGEANVLRYL